MNDIKAILQNAKIIAVVGLSDKEDRDSYQVAAFLQRTGYKIIPVNPNATEILGEVCFPDLTSIPGPVDLVNIFRKPEAVPAIADEAIEKKAKTIWMQEGIVNEEAEAKAKASGLNVVMNKCILKEYRRYF
jgi:predicted CoA-binding protein